MVYLCLLPLTIYGAVIEVTAGGTVHEPTYQFSDLSGNHMTNLTAVRDKIRASGDVETGHGNSIDDLATRLAAAEATNALVTSLQSSITSLQSSITSLQSSLDKTRNSILACWAVLPPSVTTMPSGYRYATQIECTQYFQLQFGYNPAGINRGDHAPRCYSHGWNAQGTTAYNAREGFSMYVYNSGC